MIISTLKLKPAPGKQMYVHQILHSLIGQNRVQPGCLRSAIYQDLEDCDRITYVEEWESEKDLNRHLCSDRYLKILAAMEFAGEPPEVLFHTISRTRGMDAIQEARTGQKIGY